MKSYRRPRLCVLAFVSAEEISATGGGLAEYLATNQNTLEDWLSENALDGNLKDSITAYMTSSLAG